MTTPTTVLVQLKVRSDTAANWTSANPTLLANELGRETDTGRIKIGTGSTAWTALPYQPFGALITNADISATAEIAVSKLADGAARQLLQTDAAGTGVEWTSNVDIPGTLDVTGTATFDGAVTVAGDLTVNGTTTTIDTQTLLVEDKNIEMGVVATPTDVTADGGGITLRGTTNKTINWINATGCWTSSENLDLAAGKSYFIDGAEVINGTSLGINVTDSSLTSVGTLGSLTVADFVFAGTFIPDGSTAPSNGLYLPAANTVAISTNSVGRLFVDASGNVGVGAAPATILDSTQSAAAAYSSWTIRNTASNGYAQQQFLVGTNGANGQASVSYAPGLFFAVGPTGNDTTTPIVFRNNNAQERLRITSAGLVGVGTSSPSDIVHINKASTAATVAYLSNTGGETRIGVENNSGTGVLSGAGAYDTVIRTAASTGISFGIGYTAPAVRIDSSGRLGVGTTSPSSLLHLVSSGQPIITVADDAGRTLQIKSPDSSANPGFLGTTTNHDLLLQAGTTAGGLNVMRFNTAGSERLRIDSSGRVGIGTSSPGVALHIAASTTGNPLLRLTDNSGVGGGGRGSAIDLQGISNDTGVVTTTFARISGLKTNGTQGNTQGVFRVDTDNGSGLQTALTIDSSQRVGIGTTNPISPLVVSNGGAAGIEIRPALSDIISFNRVAGTWGNLTINSANNIFQIQGGEVGRFDNSGRLLVGTSSAFDGNTALQVKSPAASATMGVLDLQANYNSTIAEQSIGWIRFLDANGAYRARIACLSDGDSSSASDAPGRLVFSTTPDSGSSPVERLRITQAGNVLLGKTTTANGTAGINLFAGTTATGVGEFTSSGDLQLALNRLANDGALISFRQDSIEEGTISVSGTTVTLNGAHLSRWSQIPGIDPHDKAVRPEILRGTVMSNLDEMCDWIDLDSGDAQANEQLNKTKISDVEGDKNAAGVFQSWDDDDDTWVNDYYLAMTGDFVIRIAAGVTVERGDLLMSAGDGTAKPQADDAVRSCTVAKVTSTHVSHTHPDGSYCVPCVLMAC